MIRCRVPAPESGLIRPIPVLLLLLCWRIMLHSPAGIKPPDTRCGSLLNTDHSIAGLPADYGENMQEPYDIVIVGGGLVGLSMLRALPPEQRARALLLDAAPAPDTTRRVGPPGLDDRGTALNRRSLDTLADWQVLPALRDTLGEIRQIEVSQQGYWGVSTLQAADNEPAFGAVVSNRHLGHALYDSLLNDAARPTIRHDCSAVAVSFAPAAAQISLADGDRVDARLLILADGGRSALSPALGLHYREHDYRQVAFTLNLEREHPAAGQAYERFSQDGPRALLPLAGNRQTAVWVVPQRQADSIRQWREEDWQDALQRCFGTDQGRILATSEATHYPLRSRRLTEQARARLAVIGNGALTLHPVAGQGFNLHLRSLSRLGALLSLADDPGDAALLRHWAQSVSSDQRQIDLACHGLVSLFGLSLPPLAHLRGLGLAAFNGLPGVRGKLTRRAMGYH